MPLSFDTALQALRAKFAELSCFPSTSNGEACGSKTSGKTTKTKIPTYDGQRFRFQKVAPWKPLKGHVKEFDFLALPPEIRCLVYEHVFHGMELECGYSIGTKRVGETKPLQPYYVLIGARGLDAISLPLTSKQIYAETRLYLVRAMKLVFNVGYEPRFLHKISFATPLYRSISDFTLENIRYIDRVPLPLTMTTLDSIPAPDDYHSLLRPFTSLRVCVAIEMKFSHIPMRLIRKCRDEGPACFFKFLDMQYPRGLLVGGDVETAAQDSSPQIILVLHLVPACNRHRRSTLR